jgi:hypothetical protein
MAAKAAQRALQAARKVSESYQRAQMLNQVTTALIETGQGELAADAAQLALQAVPATDSSLARGWALREAAEALARAGQVDQGLQVAASLDAGDRAWTLNRMTQALTQIGQATQAWLVALGIDDAKQRAGALSFVSEALAADGQTGQAAEAAGQALQAAAVIGDPLWRARALDRLLTNPVIRSSQDPEMGRRALQLLLLTASAPEHLPAFPIALLQRLLANGLV